MADASRKTTSRRELQMRHDAFGDVSPEAGELDQTAFEELFGDDPDEALSMLADMSTATDARLRELARRLAGRLVLDLAERGTRRRRGVGKLKVERLPETGGDLDVDASLEGLVSARAAGAAPDARELRGPQWARPTVALCLVVDRSGSMAGERLAAAAVAAASVAYRCPADHSVMAFASDVIVLKGQDVARPPERVVQDLFVLRGHGTTDLAMALRVAGAQLARTNAQRRIAILLSDCRDTCGGDTAAAARGLDELVVVAPGDDSADAAAFAGAVGARWAPLPGPSAVPEVLAELLAV